MAMPTIDKKFLDVIISDLIALSYECKRKYPPVKEAAEACQLKVRTIGTKQDQITQGLMSSSVDVVQPFILGCDTKNPKIVQLSLVAIQRLISQQLLSTAAAGNVVNALWVLMEASIEELRLLQTAILLITTSSVVQRETLARALVLCFRLHFTKDSTTTNTAAATIRQIVSVVFERVVTEDATPVTGTLESISLEDLKTIGNQAPKSLRPAATDAYLLFQDFCHLLNAEQPHWLLGMTEMTRTLCLELMEEVLANFYTVFLQHMEFSFLLKEKVCPLVIRLFSPSLKYRSRGVGSISPATTPTEKPYFPIVMRLLRIVSVLTRHYSKLLVTECEIFLSLLVKFLDPEKSQWQRITALEVLSKLCVQPHLIRGFCESYDMREHSTKVVRDIVSGLASFIQSQFINQASSNVPQTSKPADTTIVPQSVSSAGVAVLVTSAPQPSFCYRGIWIPLVVNISAAPGSLKAMFLDMMEKVDPPPVPDGYGLSLAFVCMLEIVRCIQTLVHPGVPQEVHQPTTAAATTAEATESSLAAEKAVKEELVNSSWCGVLAALSLLLDASCDELATEAILKCLQSYVGLCGEMDLVTPRDAIIIALCKASLPPHYALQVLTVATDQKGSSGRSNSQDAMSVASETVNGSPVVASGMPLATVGMVTSSHQVPVMLTAKNIQCMRALLSLGQCYGSILGSAWHHVLATLQHLSWVLGLKPGPGGSLRPTQQASENAGCVITAQFMADLPVLSAMLSRLFEGSQHLDDVALHHLIDALCKLSSEAMDIAYANKEPSLFAVAKLLETGLVNRPRIEVLWRTVTGHLFEVCQHPHQGLRTWAAEALTALVKSALSYNYEPPLQQQPKLQVRLLAPLQEICIVTHADVRQRQLECVLQILQNNAEQLSDGWPLILAIIGEVTNGQGEGLVRTAFQSLQLVVTDFLPTMPCSCLPVCVDVTAKFGLQHQDLNISLTAVGLLWNISDFFSQNKTLICSQLPVTSPTSAPTSSSLIHPPSLTTPAATGIDRDSSPAAESLPAFDTLWMGLYVRLGDLCVDQRPAVRKSAGQTLFSMIAAHGALLKQTTWQAMLWKVLFPLLDRVKRLSSQASDRRDDSRVGTGGGNILMHHSRDTAEKQWAETRFLTLAGVARVFNAKRRTLQQLGDFLRAWALLLEYIESAALCQNAEVSLAALKSFQEILHIPASDSADLQNSEPGRSSDELKALFGRRDMAIIDEPEPTGNGGKDDMGSVDEVALWLHAWRVWRSIGTSVTNPPEAGAVQTYVPSQAFLTALVSTFPALFTHIRSQFVAAELQRLFIVLQRALCVPIVATTLPFFVIPVTANSNEVATLTPLHEAVLGAIKVIIKEVLSGAENMPAMCPDLFERLLVFIDYAIRPPKLNKVDAKLTAGARASQFDLAAYNNLLYVPFAEATVELVVELFRATAKFPSVIHAHILQRIVHAFRGPLSVKYGCPSQSTWLLVINSLFTVLSIGLPIARKNEPAFQGMWIELGSTLEDFLFPQKNAPDTMSVEDLMRDEAIDCRVVQLIRDDILPTATKLPRDFIAKLMHILNRGSIHSATSSAFIDTESSRKLRESFAKACFETLLQFSFVTQPVAAASAAANNTSTSGSSGDDGVITQLAITSLLDRCKSVLIKFVADERLGGKCPLPRPRMTEISFVLKAVSTLISTLKKTPSSTVDKSVWCRIIDLYPSLVDCTTSQSPDVCVAVHDALMQYKDLLTPPSGVCTTNGTV